MRGHMQSAACEPGHPCIRSTHSGMCTALPARRCSWGRGAFQPRLQRPAFAAPPPSSLCPRPLLPPLPPSPSTAAPSSHLPAQRPLPFAFASAGAGVGEAIAPLQGGKARGAAGGNDVISNARFQCGGRRQVAPCGPWHPSKRVCCSPRSALELAKGEPPSSHPAAARIGLKHHGACGPLLPPLTALSSLPPHPLMVPLPTSLPDGHCCAQPPARPAAAGGRNRCARPSGWMLRCCDAAAADDDTGCDGAWARACTSNAALIPSQPPKKATAVCSAPMPPPSGPRTSL